MIAATFRWLLTLLALLTPTAFPHRPGQEPVDPARETVRLSATAETVFRHYV